MHKDKEHITLCKRIPFKNVHNGDALSPITSTLSNRRKLMRYISDVNFTISDISYKHIYKHSTTSYLEEMSSL